MEGNTVEASEETRLCVLPNELIGLGSPVLDILMDFLPEKSLKNCRQVCSSWEDAARRSLMKQCGLNVQAFFLNVRRSELSGVELYSSWIVECKRSLVVVDWENFLEEWGEVAKSLTLKGIILEDENCWKWIRRLLLAWCPGVRELNLEFKDGFTISGVPGPKLRGELREFQEYLEDGDEGKFKQIWMGKEEDHVFAPFRVLRNIQSVRVGKRANEMTSFFSINILLSCPNLKKLFVSEARTFREDILDGGFPNMLPYGERKGGWRILDFLSKRPHITMKLETFEWQDDQQEGCGSFPVLFDFFMKPYVEDARNNSRPFLQFGNCLKTLNWNVLHSDSTMGDLLFPGMLEQVAGNLRKLDLRMLRTRSEDSRQRRPWGCGPGRPRGHLNPPFPSMPKLSILQIGLRDCYKISSFTELVDSAPNLSTLQISSCGVCDEEWIQSIHPTEDPWEVHPSERTHNKLKCLKSGQIPRNTESLRRIVNKFPNLEELCIGVELDKRYDYVREKYLKLDGNDGIFPILEQLKSLQRFDWKIIGRVDLYELLAGFAEAAERIPSLKSCHIHVRFVACPLVLPEDHEDAVERERFLTGRTKLLDRILKTKQSACKFIVTADYEKIFAIKIGDSETPILSALNWKDLLLEYIKRHRLPIEFHHSS
jgi:hypothetical protein